MPNASDVLVIDIIHFISKKVLSPVSYESTSDKVAFQKEEKLFIDFIDYLFEEHFCNDGLYFYT